MLEEAGGQISRQKTRRTNRWPLSTLPLGYILDGARIENGNALTLMLNFSMEPKALYLVGKRSTNWPTSPALDHFWEIILMTIITLVCGEVLCSSGWSWTHYRAEVDLEFLILLAHIPNPGITVVCPTTWLCYFIYMAAHLSSPQPKHFTTLNRDSNRCAIIPHASLSSPPSGTH